MGDRGLHTKIRNGDFKLGVIHGKIKASKNKPELFMQRNIFLCQTVKIKYKRNNSANPDIRLIAYEMPLGVYRDKCVDLVGYDKDHNLYLIELKDVNNKEKLCDVENQINDYAHIVDKNLRSKIQNDFKEKFHIPITIKKIKKVILAPQGYYKVNAKPPHKDIDYLYIKDPDVANIRSNNFNKIKFNRAIQLHLFKKWT
jgi:hypothetical protein